MTESTKNMDDVLASSMSLCDQIDSAVNNTQHDSDTPFIQLPNGRIYKQEGNVGYEWLKKSVAKTLNKPENEVTDEELAAMYTFARYTRITSSTTSAAETIKTADYCSSNFFRSAQIDFEWIYEHLADIMAGIDKNADAATALFDAQSAIRKYMAARVASEENLLRKAVAAEIEQRGFKSKLR